MRSILVITDNIPAQINGVVTTYKNMEEYALADGYLIEYLTPENFVYCSAPKYPEVKISLPWGIGHKILQKNPDHIHIATEGTLGLAANLWCWRNNYKFNTGYHSRWPEFMRQIYGIPEWLTITYLRWFHNHSGQVITTTKTMVDELLKQKYKSNIIPWTRGVDRTIFNSTQRVNSTNRKLVLLNVGRVSREKGLDDFCSLQFPNAEKIVVGDGPYRTELESKYPDVLFVGARRGTELAKYFANADVFVFPSKTDTFGIVIIESIACGTPVAAYPVSGPCDIIASGLNGCMSNNLREAIESCLLLDRSIVEDSGHAWTWKAAWEIFRDALVSVKNT